MIFVSSLAACWYWQVGLSDAYCNGFSILSNCAIKVNLGCRNWGSPSCCQKNSGYEINSIFFPSLWQLWSAILWFIVSAFFHQFHISEIMWKKKERKRYPNWTFFVTLCLKVIFMSKHSCHIEKEDLLLRTLSLSRDDNSLNDRIQRQDTTKQH